MTDSPELAFQIGPWLIEPALNQISADNVHIQLEPMNMAVLVMLFQHKEAVVSTDDIIQTIWHGRAMGDNPVYKSVARLRQVLGDDPKDPQYIITVPKKGYRLLPLGNEALETRNQSNAPLSRFFQYSSQIILAVLVIIFITAFLLWPSESNQHHLTPISVFAGSHSQPSLAPDGKSIAFVSDSLNSSQIWMLYANTNSPQQLTFGEQNASRPRWSPDGEQLLFMQSGSIWSVATSGGEPREVIRDAYHPNWSFDGRRIVFERRNKVWVAATDGSAQQLIEGIPHQELPLAARWPAFSPDGKQIVYFDTVNTPMGDLWIIALENGKPQRLTFKPAIGSAPVWSTDGLTIIYSSMRGGSRTLWQVNVADKKVESILFGSGDDDFPDINRKNNSLVFSNSRERFLLVESNLSNQHEISLQESRTMLFAPELSKQGDKIAYFGSARSGGIQLFSLPRSGGQVKQITNEPLSTHAIPKWSNDGSRLYFYKTGEHTYYGQVDANGGVSSSLVDDWSWSFANGASVSPNNETVIYSRLIGQVPVQTMLHNLNDGTEQSFYATLEYPQWSADGQFLLGGRHLDQRFPGDIAICPLQGANCRILAEEARIPMWSFDESQVYYVRGFGHSQQLFRRPSDGSGDEQFLFNMQPLHPLGPFYAVTEDETIIWVKYEKGRSELWALDIF